MKDEHTMELAVPAPARAGVRGRPAALAASYRECLAGR